MGLTITRQDLWGNTKVVYGDHVMPASYAAGGDPSDPGLRIIESVEIDGGIEGRLYVYDFTNKKIKALQTGAALSGVFSETGAVDLSAVKLKVVFKGQ